MPISYHKQLVCGPVRCVPSIHHDPVFAQQVRNEIDRRRPDIIALELPAPMTAGLRTAVKHLPAISAVFTIRNNLCADFCAVTGADSLIEAMRIAVQRDIHFECIDYPEPVVISSSSNTPLDSMAIESLGFAAYYHRQQGLFGGNNSDPANALREEYMAGRLQALSRQADDILFVCGMAHWERIKRRLEAVPKGQEKHSNTVYAVAAIDGPSLYRVFGLLPALAGYYEQCVERQKAFCCSDFLLAATAAIRREALEFNPHLSVRDLYTMLRYMRNLTIMDSRLLPDLYDWVTAAAGCVDEYLAGSTFDYLMRYPFASSAALPPMEIAEKEENSEQLLARYKGTRFSLKTRMPRMQPSEYKRELRIRRHTLTPRKKHPQRTKNPQWQWDGYSDDWGRYNDEMLRETAFILYLEQFYRMHRGMDDECEAQEFRGSLLDGIDTRSMMLDFEKQRIFVREERESLPAMDTVHVEFVAPATLPQRLAHTYQFGIGVKVHYAWGTTEPEVNHHDGTGHINWVFLTSVKYETSVDYVDLSMQELYDRTHQSPPHITTRAVAIERCPGRHILMVTRGPLDERTIQHAAEHGKVLHHLDGSLIPHEKYLENRMFNVYYRRPKKRSILGEKEHR